MRLDAPDRRDAPLERVIIGALEADRARFRHAIGNGHFAHVHRADHFSHDFDRTGRAGHDPGAQALEVEAREFGMFEHGDEHSRHSVQAGASLCLHGLQCRHGIESFRRAHHAGAVGDASEIAEHHAEAMIVGHRNAQAVVRGEAHGLADEIAVVQDIVMGQRRPLGRAGGPGRELDVDRVVELKRRLEGDELGALARRRGLHDLVEVEHARRLVRA